MTPAPSVTTAATANVLRTLRPVAAVGCLTAVLAADPDLVALQEWGPGRGRMLPREAWVWMRAPRSGLAVGARRSRYAVLGVRRHRLAGWGRPDPRTRPLPVLPPRSVLTVILADRITGRRVTVVAYHLVPGSQRRGDYRADRPRLTARHRAETAALAGVVEAGLARGDTVLALGDANFDGLELPGLTSAWAGRRDDPRGTLGSARKIDDVFGSGPATAIRLIRTASDHAALVATRPDRRS